MTPPEPKPTNGVMRQNDGVDIRVHYDTILAEIDRRYEQRFSLICLSIDKSDAETERWKHSANEWRAAMSDKDKLMLTRSEYQIYHEALMKRVDDLEKYSDIARGRSSIATVISILSLIAGALLHFVK